MKSKALREQRAKLVSDARALTDAVGADGVMSGEDEARFDAIMAEADKIKANIDRIEALEASESHLAQRREHRAGREDISADDTKAAAEFETSVFRHYLKHGIANMSDEMRAVALPRIQAAQGTTTGSGGGYTIPQGFMARMEEAQLAFGGMREVSYVFSTDSGNDLPIPTDNDTSNTGALLSENTQVSNQDVAFGSVSMHAYTYSSKLVLVANQLLQDSAFDLDTYLARKLGDRLARIQNTHFTTGDGAAKPNGVVTAATSGVTAASATDITSDELIDLMHSVDPAYRMNARYMFNDATLKVLKKKKDGDGQYLWLSGLAVREPDTILGAPYTVNQSMASIATGAKPVLYGDFSKYYIRMVTGVQVLRLVERYADYNQTGFLAFQRCDGQLVDAGTHPIKYIVNA